MLSKFPNIGLHSKQKLITTDMFGSGSVKHALVQ